MVLAGSSRRLGRLGHPLGPEEEEEERRLRRGHPYTIVRRALNHWRFRWFPRHPWSRPKPASSRREKAGSSSTRKRHGGSSTRSSARERFSKASLSSRSSGSTSAFSSPASLGVFTTVRTSRRTSSSSG